MLYAGSTQGTSSTLNKAITKSELTLPTVLYYVFLTKHGTYNLKYVNKKHLHTIMEISTQKQLAKEAGQYARQGFMEKKNQSIVLRLIIGEISGFISFVKEIIRYVSATIDIWVHCSGKK